MTRLNLVSVSVAGLLSFSQLAQAMPSYPAHWWAPVSREGAPAWEILPQDAAPGEVILSKRHELGILSNFAPTAFTLRGKSYASVEGFWQMMLYPDPEDESDPRAKHPGITWKHTRSEVAAMTAFDAKAAGKLAEDNMKKMGISWVSFEGKRFEYRPSEPGQHYEYILEAMRSKLDQNAEVKRILLSTGDLILKPDHHSEPNAPRAWRYNEIWMELRKELQMRRKRPVPVRQGRTGAQSRN